MKKRTDFDSETGLKKCERKGPRVVRVGYVPTPDADWRLRRAIDILLSSATGEPEGSIRPQKEEDTPKDSHPERAAGQSVRGKDES